MSTALMMVAALVMTAGSGSALAAASQPSSVSGPPQEPRLQALRVQLHWSHQSQFAGVYMAVVRQHFRREGLEVVLLPGGPGIDPLAVLQRGEADVAIGWLNNAWRKTRSGPSIAHVAQLFSRSGIGIACRASEGVLRVEDMAGRSVGVWNIGDEVFVRQVLRAHGVDPGAVALVPQAQDAVDLIDRRVPCVTAMSYNELIALQSATAIGDDLIWIDAAGQGVEHLEDGLYVLSDRLVSAEFRSRLAGLLRAVTRGWADARIAPGLALDWLSQRDPAIDRRRQAQMLAAVLELLPERAREFGVLDLTRFERQATLLRSEDAIGSEPVRPLWTMRIVEELDQREGRARLLTHATQHHLNEITDSAIFQGVILTGVLIFSSSGLFLAMQLGFGLWGCVLLAVITALGGGVLRDLLMGGDRLPLQIVVDPTAPIAIALIVVVVLAVSRRVEPARLARWLAPLERIAAELGLGLIAVYGCSVSLRSGYGWFWSAVFAAVTVSGGGILRDILLAKPSLSLTGDLANEEAAIAGALVLIAGLLMANHFEHQPWIVHASFVLAVLLTPAVSRWLRASGGRGVSQR